MPFTATPIQIPVEVEQNLVLVPVRVGSSGRLTFILDTGAQASVIASDRLVEAGLSGGAASAGTAQGGEIETRLFKGARVRVGSLDIGKTDISAVDLAALSAGVGRRIDGILGYEFFRDRIIRIDYSAQKVLALSARSYLGPGIPLRIAIRGNTPFVEARVSQLHNTAKGRFLLDTGALGAVNLYAQFLKTRPPLRPKRSLALTSGAILPGQFVTQVGRLTSLTIGALRIRDPLTNFSGRAGADDAAPGDAGLIGSYVLSRYVVTFDYPHGRVMMAPKAVNAPFVFDGSGLSLSAADPSFKTKKVRLVLPNSPAAAAGITPGDLLLAIDGQSSEALSLGQIRQMFRKVGVSYKLQFRRDGTPITVELLTRQLI